MEEENLVLWGRVEADMSADTPSANGYQKIPTPPPPKEGEQGYGAYMDRMATEEKEFHQEQKRKWEEWQQLSTEFKVLKCSFATNEPHPGDDVLQWLKWNDGNLRTYPKWATELQSICPINYRELARQMYLSWQWPKAVDKLGILNIPCPPAPDHLRVWMFKVDDLSHLKLMPNHYLCVQYAQEPCNLQLQLLPTLWCAGLLKAWLHLLHPWALFYTITEDMWWNHALTPPFHKPYHEFNPWQQATQYFNGLRDVREEALHFKEAQRKVSFHDSIPRYKREEGFLNYGRGWGSGIISQGGKASTVGATSNATTGQFADATAPVAPTTLSLEGMPALEDSEPLIGTIAPDTGTYEPTGNKFTRSHSPGLRMMKVMILLLAAKELPLGLHQTTRNKMMKTICQPQMSVLEPWT